MDIRRGVAQGLHGRLRGDVRKLGEDTGFDRPAGGGGKNELLPLPALFDADGKTAVVQLAMMVAAQGDQVGEAGFAAVCPVPDVVRIHVTRFTATGETAGFIPDGQGAADVGGNSAGAAADI